MTKVQSYLILVSPNVTMELSNVRKKIRVQLNTVKVWSYVMLVLSNVNNGTVKYEKKNKGITEYDKSIVTCNVGTAQYKDGTVKCKKKTTTKCNESIVKCDVGTA